MMAELFVAILRNNINKLSELIACCQYRDVLHHCFGLLLHISSLASGNDAAKQLESYTSQLQQEYCKIDNEPDLLSEELQFTISKCIDYFVRCVPASSAADVIEAGFPLCIQDADGRTLLHHATLADSVEWVKLLIGRGIDVDVTDNRNVTPLMLACRAGSLACVRLLLKHTDEPNKCDVIGETALHYSCKSDNTSVVKLLLENGVEFRQNSQGETELMVALSRNLEAVGRLLIEFGVDVNAKNRQRATALHYAAKFDCPSIVKLLSESDIQKDSHGYTPFAIAAKNGHHRTLEALLECYPRKHLYDMKTMTHNTPLQLATMTGHYRCVELLLNAGATVDYKNCLCLAAYGGNRDVLELMINKYKKDLGSNWHFIGMDSVNKLGMSPLHVAAMYGHEACVKLSIEEGANPCQAMPVTGETPLMLTIVKNYHHCAKTIIDAIGKNQSFGLNCVTPKKRTALHYAATQDAQKCVQLLIEAGAALDIRDSKGYTPLLLAVENGHHDVVKVLLAAGCDLNATRLHGWNGLHLATQNNHLHCVRHLVAAGIDLDSVTWDTSATPVSIAAQQGHADVLQYLLESRANCTCPDAMGLSPMHHAAKNDHAKCARLLVRHHSPIEIEDKQGQTPTTLAALHGSVHALALLILYNGKVSCFEFSKIRTRRHYADVLWLLLQIDSRLICRLGSSVLPSAGELEEDQSRLLSAVTCSLVNVMGTLKQLCRLVIRSSMRQGIGFINDVETLPLPKYLKKYVTLEEDCARYEAYP